MESERVGGGWGAHLRSLAVWVCVVGIGLLHLGDTTYSVDAYPLSEFPGSTVDLSLDSELGPRSAVEGIGSRLPPPGSRDGDPASTRPADLHPPESVNDPHSEPMDIPAIPLPTKAQFPRLETSLSHLVEAAQRGEIPMPMSGTPSSPFAPAYVAVTIYYDPGAPGSHETIIDNDFGTTNPVVVVSAGDAGFSTDSCGTWTKVA